MKREYENLSSIPRFFVIASQQNLISFELLLIPTFRQVHSKSLITARRRPPVNRQPRHNHNITITIAFAMMMAAPVRSSSPPPPPTTATPTAFASSPRPALCPPCRIRHRHQEKDRPALPNRRPNRRRGPHLNVRSALAATIPRPSATLCEFRNLGEWRFVPLSIPSLPCSSLLSAASLRPRPWSRSQPGDAP